MTDLLKRVSGLIGAAFAAACCLGLPALLSALAAAGLGFLINDALLFPIFVGSVSFALYNLWGTTTANGSKAPFWLGSAGGLAGSVGLWLMVTGTAPTSWLIYLGLGTLVGASVWDVVNGQRKPACADDACEVPAPVQSQSAVLGKRAVVGVAAATAFVGLYKSVDVFIDKAEEGEIACWGANGCKGETACTTAFNACTGMNSCKGKGYIYLPSSECDARGGEPLKGSEGDPAGAG